MIASTSSTARAPRKLTVIGAAAILLLAMSSAAQAQVPPSVERLARQLENQTPLKDGRGQPPQSPTDTTAPSFRLPAQIAELQRILAKAKPRVAVPVRAALGSVETAWAAFRDGSGDQSLSHLDATLVAVGDAQRALVDAIAVANDSTDVRLRGVQMELSLAGQRVARDVNDQARAAGVSETRLDPADAELAAGDAALARGDHVAAAGHFQRGQSLSANTIVFDIGRFEANIHSAYDSRSVGNSYATPSAACCTARARAARPAPRPMHRPSRNRPPRKCRWPASASPSPPSW